MEDKNIGLVLYTKLIKDHDLYIKILSSDDYVLTGVVFGGNSSKKRTIYQVGNFIEFNKLQKNLNSINTITGEVISPYINSIYEDKYKSFSLLAIISILNESLYEGIQINGIYFSINNLINIINSEKHWLVNFCEWLLIYLKLLGYEIDYYNNKNKLYFDLNSLLFVDNDFKKNTVLFPHNLFYNKYKTTYESVKSLFIIFETIFIKNQLNNFNDQMPKNYLNFKKLILDKLSNLKT